MSDLQKEMLAELGLNPADLRDKTKMEELKRRILMIQLDATKAATEPDDLDDGLEMAQAMRTALKLIGAMTPAQARQYNLAIAAGHEAPIPGASPTNGVATLGSGTSGNSEADALTTQFTGLVATNPVVAKFLLELTAQLEHLKSTEPQHYALRAEAARMLLEGSDPNWEVGELGGRPVPKMWQDEQALFWNFLMNVPGATRGVPGVLEGGAFATEKYAAGERAADPTDQRKLAGVLGTLKTAAETQIRRLTPSRSTTP